MTSWATRTPSWCMLRLYATSWKPLADGACCTPFAVSATASERRAARQCCKTDVPIRLRLTLWYGFLLGSTLLVFCIGLYLGLAAGLERDFDQTLRVRAAQVERELVASSEDDASDLSADEIGAD